ncbi:hypothetical protein QX205_15630 [Acinetobacter pittii]|uniref:hypothetical protein n=1 Tax=Acinetobacter pittii TaxID=48296 RepID=UPI0025B45117|nr:hypothetical protein [Acinetobacter pittii]MDN4021506.1 hypothetical protein [Acinetobacter pittii]
MTLFLQADKSLKLPKLSEKVSGAVLQLDFRDNTFKRSGSDAALSTLIEKTSQGVGGKYDAYGTWEQVVQYGLDVSVDQQTFNRGLLIEAPFANLFLNSKTPVTQTISITVAAVTEAFILSVAGTGSVEIKIGSKSFGTASYQKPLVLYGSDITIGTFDAVLTVTGTLSYVGFYRTVQAVERVARVTTVGNLVTRVGDVVKINQAVLNTLLTNFTGCIVVKNYIPNDIFDRSKTNAQSGSIIQVKNTAHKGYFVARQENGPMTNLLRRIDATEKIEQTGTQLSSSNVYALNFNPASAKLAHNGSLSNELTLTGVTLSDIFIGSGDNWSTVISNYIQEVLLFDRNLTDQELIAISSL